MTYYLYRAMVHEIIYILKNKQKPTSVTTVLIKNLN